VKKITVYDLVYNGNLFPYKNKEHFSENWTVKILLITPTMD